MSIPGQILDIDLTTETWKLSQYPKDLAGKFLGGRGFVQFGADIACESLVGCGQVGLSFVT